MNRLVLWPYKLADAENVTFSPWEWSMSETWAELVEGVRGWDPRTEIKFRCSYQVDLAALRVTRVVEDHIQCSILTIVDCPETKQRITLCTELIEQPTGEICISVPPGLMSGLVNLEHQLVVTGARDAVRNAIGSKLLAQPNVARAHLIENVNRFPTEAFSFQSAQMRPLDWHLEIQNMSDSILVSSFKEAVALWVNTDRHAAEYLLNPRSPFHKHYTALVEREILWSLFTRATEEKSFDVLRDEIGDGSVGRALINFSQLSLKMSIESFVDLVQFDGMEALRLINLALPLPELNN